MPLPIIEIPGLGKRYRIGAHKEPYLSLRDEFAKPFRRLSAAFPPSSPASCPPSNCPTARPSDL